MAMASVSDGSSEPPGTPQQHPSAPDSAAWRPRRGGLDGGAASTAAVHWDSDVEANHTPGGSRRHKDEHSLVRRLWESLPTAASAVGQASSGSTELGLLEKGSAVQWSLWKSFEGWELVAAFAAALMLVNGVALLHASGPGITFLQGAGARPRQCTPSSVWR